MNIKKGDKVTVITGTNKGVSGTVLKVFPVECRVLIEGVNMKKRHERARRAGQKGQMVEKPHPVHVSNVKKQGK